MPTSSYMPDVVVELALGDGFSTPAASRTWTDVSAYVELAEGITISGGRSDERSFADANQLSLTLDNSDGRFTAGRVTGAYYPDVKLDVPIRVTADPVDGAASTRFTGYVNEWPTEWDGTDAYAKAPITASSRLARLGLTTPLASIIETEIMADSPVVYYPLGEPEGSTLAADVSGNAAGPLTMTGSGTDVVFGTATGPGTDSLTAAEFAGGKYLRGAGIAVAAGVAVEAFTLRNGIPAGYEPFVALGDQITVAFTLTGTVAAYKAGSVIVESVAVLADNATHHVAVSVSAAGAWVLYVDGVSVDTAAGTTVTGTPDISVGGYPSLDPAGVGTPASTLTGVVAHIAAYPSVLTAARILAHATAGVDGYAGDLTDVRLDRYATYGGIPPAEVDSETGTVTMAHVDTTDQPVVDMMRVVETTEGGVLFDDRDGDLVFHNRAHRYNVSSAYTLDMAQGEVEADYAPRLDRSSIANDISAANTAGTYSARRRDTASIAAYGVASASVTTAAEDDDEPLQIVSWLLGVYAEPRVRVPTLSVDVLAQVGKTPNCSAVMATTVGTKLTASNHPTQAATSSSDYFAEGWTEQIGPESYVMTFNVSPSSPWDQTLILGDASRGFLGVNQLAY